MFLENRQTWLVGRVQQQVLIACKLVARRRTFLHLAVARFSMLSRGGRAFTRVAELYRVSRGRRHFSALRPAKYERAQCLDTPGNWFAETSTTEFRRSLRSDLPESGSCCETRQKHLLRAIAISPFSDFNPLDACTMTSGRCRVFPKGLLNH